MEYKTKNPHIYCKKDILKKEVKKNENRRPRNHKRKC